MNCNGVLITAKFCDLIGLDQFFLLYGIIYKDADVDFLNLLLLRIAWFPFIRATCKNNNFPVGYDAI